MLFYRLVTPIFSLFHFFLIMLFTENQRQWSIKLINDLYKWNLTAFFRLKLNPNSESYQEYCQKVKRPLDLDTVKTTLYDGNYKTVEEFVRDLKLVFQNAVTYYGPSHVFTMMADEILLWIQEQEKSMNLSEDEKWMQDLLNLQNKLEEHLKNKPQGFAQSLLPPR